MQLIDFSKIKQVIFYVTCIQYVEDLFRKLKTNPDEFFDKVSDTVNWMVEGTHPLAGCYKTKKDFLDHTFKRFPNDLQGGAKLKF
jgi:uncharacterized protein